MTTVTKRAPSRRDRKKIELRSRIMAAAIDLFSKHGIDGVTVDQIAQTADTGKGTIYNYFQTKEDIVVAFMVDIERKVQSKVRGFAESNDPLDSILAGYVNLQFRLKRPYHAFVRAFLAQMFLRTESFLPYMIEMQSIIDPTLETLFRRLQERGAIRQDIGVADLIVIFKTIHLGLNSLWAVEGPPFRATACIVKQEMKLFCEGLRTTKS